MLRLYHGTLRESHGAIMKNVSAIGIARMLLCLIISFGLAAYAPSHSQENKTVQKEPAMTNHATGSFDVKMTPQKPDNPVEEAAKFGRMTGEKQFHGDMEGSSKVEMLAISPDAKGSG